MRETEKKAVEAYEKLYGTPDGTLFVPYRICPLGAHSDHQLGQVTGFAIDLGIYICYGASDDGTVRAASLQFAEKVSFPVSGAGVRKNGDWADYLRGAAVSLAGRRVMERGINMVAAGEFPIGGLSSSASLTIGFAAALCRVNGITLSPEEMIDVSMESENRFVGVSSGKLDQSCELYSAKGKLLHVDLLDGSHELLAPGPGMPEYDILVLFSGVERNLAGSAFNMRVDECRSAAYSLKALSGMPYGKFKDTNLRDVPYDIYLEYRDSLPWNFRKRAEHWYSEFARVSRGTDAWQRGDIEEFGRLVSESGRSSIVNWETGSDELRALYDVLVHTDGVYGGRFSGAGFKGSCVAFSERGKRERILEEIKRGYLKLFPRYEQVYKSAVCTSIDGIKL